MPRRVCQICILSVQTNQPKSGGDPKAISIIFLLLYFTFLRIDFGRKSFHTPTSSWLITAVGPEEHYYYLLLLLLLFLDYYLRKGSVKSAFY